MPPSAYGRTLDGDALAPERTRETVTGPSTAAVEAGPRQRCGHRSAPRTTAEAEDEAYLGRQLVTCLGNKRAFARQLEWAVADVRRRLGGRRLSAVDLFAGSGFVSRVLKRHADRLVANDLEEYAVQIGRCFLADRDKVPFGRLRQIVDTLNAAADAGGSRPGFIQELYAPADDRDVQAGERAFYTRDNGRRLDFFAQELQDLEPAIRPLLLGPLLSEASIHANTSGVFKGFHKDKQTGVGKFGGGGGDALGRILQPIRLEVPVLSAFTGEWTVHQRDANVLVRELPEHDLVYLDPPYNQHPYGSNYFMLNLIATYRRPREISAVSGIPTDWNRSGYNVRKRSLPLLADLIEHAPARFVLLSFNAEGFVPIEELRALLAGHGRVGEVVVPYRTFRGSRNLRSRGLDVDEHLFLLERR